MKYKGWIAAGLILGLLALCAAIAGVLVLSLRSADFSSAVLPFGRSLDFSVEELEERSFMVSGPVTLTVDNDLAGAVRVVKGAGGAVDVRMKKTANGINQQEAQKNLDRLEIETTQTGDAVDIRVRVPQGGLWSGAVEFDITVPEQTTVQVESDAGELKLEGTRGDAVLSTTFGAVTVMDVGDGELKVTTRNGRVEASNVKVGENTIEMTSDFGDVALRDAAAGAVTLKSNNGALNLRDVHAAGKVSLNSDFGRVEFLTGKAEGLEVKTQNGAVTLHDIEGAGSLSVSSSFGAIDVQRVRASGYDLKTQNGTIRLDEAEGTIKAHSDFGDVEVTGARDAILDLRGGNGAVRFDGSLGRGPHELHSEFGAITVRLAQDAQFDFDVKTDFGKIRSDFEVTLRGEMDEHHWQGKVNGGGDLLTVTTKNGNITLEVR